jgi:leader peptidase (prepilin peptidase)/N-methyltransferase
MTPSMPASEALLPPEAAWAAVAALGLIFGSFLNVCIHRLPRRESILRPRSRCPGCGSLIRWFDNVPLVSFALLGGRCRTCRAPIDWSYPAVEAANAAAYLLLYARYGAGAAFAILAAFASSLIVLVVIDARHQILPDRITLPMLALGLATSGVSPEVSWLDSLRGAALGAAAPAALLLGWQWIFKVEGMGWGDVKMLGMVGAFLGPWRALLTLLGGACLGALVGAGLMARGKGSLKTPLPFGVFLGIMAAAVLWRGSDLLRWYAARLAATGDTPW